MKEMSFENAMQELEEITGKLEKGNLSLDESVASFEEGMKLAKKCNNILEDAEKKIKILVQKDENIEEEDFKIEEQKRGTVLEKNLIWEMHGFFYTI